MTSLACRREPRPPHGRLFGADDKDGRRVCVDGGRLSSEGGLLALREIERRLGLAERLANCLTDPRAPERVWHRLAEIIRFRMLMIAAGYEDGNDAEALRRDPMFKLALDRLPSDEDLCSQSTISRLENLPDRQALLRLAGALVEQHCASFRQVPRRFADRWETDYARAVRCLRDDLDELLTCWRYKSITERKRVRTTNAIERRFREVCRRTRPMGDFSDRASMDRILFAVFNHENRN